MKDQLVLLETAKIAREKGFDIPCHYYFTKPNKIDEAGEHFNHAQSTKGTYIGPEDILINRNGYKTPTIFSRPTQSLLQKWLREEHKIVISPFIAWNLITWGYNIHFIASKDVYEEASKRIYHGADCKSYEEALEQGLIEALNII